LNVKIKQSAELARKLQFAIAGARTCAEFEWCWQRMCKMTSVWLWWLTPQQ